MLVWLTEKCSIFSKLYGFLTRWQICFTLFQFPLLSLDTNHCFDIQQIWFVLCECVSIDMEKGMDENVKNFPLRVQYFHSIFKCADPSVHSKIKGIKDLLDPLSDPCTTLKTTNLAVRLQRTTNQNVRSFLWGCYFLKQSR